MAILLYFRKDEELDATVRYRVGPSIEELTVDLVLDKATGEVAAGPGQRVDRLALSVAGNIVRLWRERGTWPENGVKAS